MAHHEEVLGDKHSQHRKVPNAETAQRLWLHSRIKQESGCWRTMKLLEDYEEYHQVLK